MMCLSTAPTQWSRSITKSRIVPSSTPSDRASSTLTRSAPRAAAYSGDSLARTASLHKILDPSAGPLIAIRMNILTCKTLDGLQTNLPGQVLGSNGQPVRGLHAAGEVAGYRALEGTFLGGCVFSGRAAGRATAANA